MCWLLSFLFDNLREKRLVSLTKQSGIVCCKHHILEGVGDSPGLQRCAPPSHSGFIKTQPATMYKNVTSISKHKSSVLFQVFFFLHGGAAGDGRGMVTWVGRHPNCGCRLCPERQNPEGPPQPQGNGPQLRFLLWARLCLCNPRHQCSLRDQPFAGSGVAGRHVHILGETSAALVAGQNQTPAGALCP